MGFTHYWNDLELSKYPEGLIDVFNQAYQDFLRSWVTIEGKHLNLFSTFFKMDEDEDLFNEHFHEYSTGASWQPLLFGSDTGWTFCKTARKSYDVAVVLTLYLASVVTWKDYSSDGDVIYCKEQLEQYVKDNLDNSYQYDFKKLYELFDLWLNKCIAFSIEHEEEMQKVEDEKQYDRICDLPETELNYLCSQIRDGVTSIYLNNGQVVDISFRD